MAIYIVGDIQGCLEPLQRLMNQVNFEPTRDELWSVGDVVNRGPKSLETLRFLKSLKDQFKMVLGNHDLHLIAIHYGIKPPKQSDTLQAILDAPDRNDLINWLRRHPLILCQDNNTLVHAGIPPIWTISKALQLSHEVEAVLQSDDPTPFLNNMYGNKPDHWRESVDGLERLRLITNYLTRMRICTENSKLNLTYNKGIKDIPEGYAPWFSFPRQNEDSGKNIFFGHWAALESKSYYEKFHALDSGCVWGKQLTFYRVHDKTRFNCNCNL